MSRAARGRKATLTGFLILAIIAFFLWPQGASAKVYRYVDKDGTVSYTDSMQAVPEGQRKKAKVVEGVREQETQPAGEDRQTTDPGSVHSFKDQLQSLTEAVMKKGHWKDIAVVASGVVILLLIGRARRVIGPNAAWTILRIIAVLGVLAYFFFAYTKGMSDIFETLKKSVGGVRERIEKKQVDQYRRGGE